MPAAAETTEVLGLAAAALGGDDTAARARALPRMAQRPMAQLTRATPNLATTTAGDLRGRLQARIDELQAAEHARAAAAAAAEQQARERLAAERAEAEARAAAALETARRELDALPVAADSRRLRWLSTEPKVQGTEIRLQWSPQAHTLEPSAERDESTAANRYWPLGTGN